MLEIGGLLYRLLLALAGGPWLMLSSVYGRRNSTQVRQELVSQIPGSLHWGWLEGTVCPNPAMFLLILFRSRQGRNLGSERDIPRARVVPSSISRVMFRNFLLL